MLWPCLAMNLTYSVWTRLGSPQAPTPAQYAQVRQSGQLTSLGPATTVKVEGGKMTLQTSLPRQAVALFGIERP